MSIGSSEELPLKPQLRFIASPGALDMTDWESPWHCEYCGETFAPGQSGAVCSRCQRPFCVDHLRLLQDSEAALADRIVCASCVQVHEQCKPLRWDQLWRTGLARRSR